MSYKIPAILIVLFIAITACHPKLSVYKATSRKWAGGTQGKSGVVYQFSLFVQASWNDLSVDSVQIGTKVFTDESTEVLGREIGRSDFNPGDSILVTVRASTGDQISSFKGYIYYTLKGKSRSLELNEVKELKSVQYP
jgi:hypothetical protein